MVETLKWQTACSDYAALLLDANSLSRVVVVPHFIAIALGELHSRFILISTNWPKSWQMVGMADFFCLESANWGRYR